MRPEHCTITVTSTYCQSWIVDILMKVMRGWGWQVTRQHDGQFECKLP